MPREIQVLSYFLIERRYCFMNGFINLIAVFAFSFLIFGLPSIVSAQWRNDRNNRNDDNYDNGRYNLDLQSTVKS